MRKLLLSLVCLFCMTSVMVAADVTFLKYVVEKKELLVKEGESDKTYKVTEKTKLLLIDTDGKATEADLKILEKAKEGKTKLTITANEDRTIAEIRMRGRKVK